LHQDRHGLARMGRAARQTYQNHPGWEDSMDSVRLFLEQAIL
jgi:hypothetical protein